MTPELVQHVAAMETVAFLKSMKGATFPHESDEGSFRCRWFTVGTPAVGRRKSLILKTQKNKLFVSNIV
jgi:hypothetical protein